MTFTQQYGATGCERMFVELESESIGGSKGGARDARPPGSKFFHFHAVFGKKKIVKQSQFRSWRTPIGKILEPPLERLTLPVVR